jgi:hypothetical protein
VSSAQGLVSLVQSQENDWREGISLPRHGRHVRDKGWGSGQRSQEWPIGQVSGLHRASLSPR